MVSSGYKAAGAVSRKLDEVILVELKKLRYWWS
jgi:hypothetical protein